MLKSDILDDATHAELTELINSEETKAIWKLLLRYLKNEGVRYMLACRIGRTHPDLRHQNGLQYMETLLHAFLGDHPNGPGAINFYDHKLIDGAFAFDELMNHVISLSGIFPEQLTDSEKMGKIRQAALKLLKHKLMQSEEAPQT